jgi:hypothetical protein
MLERVLVLGERVEEYPQVDFVHGLCTRLVGGGSGGVMDPIDVRGEDIDTLEINEP